MARRKIGVVCTDPIDEVYPPELHIAAMDNDINRLNECLISGANIDSLFEDETPLHFSVYEGHLEATKFLLGKGAKTNIGASLFFLADSLEIIELLLDFGADPNYGCENRSLLSHFLNNENSLEIVKRLIKSNVDVNAVTLPDNWSPLHVCAISKSKALAKILIENGAKIDALNRNMDTPLHVAAYFGSTVVAEILLDSGAKIDAESYKNETPLGRALSRGNFETAQLLLSYGAEMRQPKVCFKYAIGRAVQKGSFEILEKILEIVFPNGKFENYCNCKYELCKCSTMGFKTVIDATEVNSLDKIKLLLKYDFDINERDINDTTAFTSAVKAGNLELAKQLFDLGANPNLGRNTFCGLIDRADIKACKMLLEIGLEKIDFEKYAESVGQVEIAELISKEKKRRARFGP